MSQPRPHATFCTDVYAASIELIAARHLFRNNAHLPVPSLEIIVVLKVMIPHYFHKQQHVVCPQKYLCVLHINHGWMQLVLNRCACISDDYYFILAPLPQAPPGGEPCIIYIYAYILTVPIGVRDTMQVNSCGTGAGSMTLPPRTAGCSRCAYGGC